MERCRNNKRPGSTETEVDTRQINLTRFPLLFPEKRTFFLEGSDLFNFGIGIEESFISFYSRRVGLFEGEQIPIAAGAKLLGRVGQWGMAILDVQTRDSHGVSGNKFIYRPIFLGYE